MRGGSGRSLPWKGIKSSLLFSPPPCPSSHRLFQTLFCIAFMPYLELNSVGNCLSKSTLPSFALPLWYWISLLGKGGSSLFCVANCCARENCCLESKLSVLKTQFISLNWCRCISHLRAAVFSMSCWDCSATHFIRFCHPLLAFLWLLQAGLTPLLLLIANKNLLCSQLCTQIITTVCKHEFHNSPDLLSASKCEGSFQWLSKLVFLLS